MQISFSARKSGYLCPRTGKLASGAWLPRDRASVQLRYVTCFPSGGSRRRGLLIIMAADSSRRVSVL